MGTSVSPWSAASHAPHSGLTLSRTSAAAAAVSSGFEPSERAAALLVTLRRFMSEHVYPAEAQLEAHAASPQRWTVCPVVEDLKAEAYARSLFAQLEPCLIQKTPYTP